jgi:hypothetical protein
MKPYSREKCPTGYKENPFGRCAPLNRLVEYNCYMNRYGRTTLLSVLC